MLFICFDAFILTAVFFCLFFFFVLELLRRHPSVLSEWFLTTFPDPQDWFSARLSYVRTLAVMSMVGFVVGLGDRHGENILFDSGCGDAVHVDLSCLFNKGTFLFWSQLALSNRS